MQAHTTATPKHHGPRRALAGPTRPNERTRPRHHHCFPSFKAKPAPAWPRRRLCRRPGRFAGARTWDGPTDGVVSRGDTLSRAERQGPNANGGGSRGRGASGGHCAGIGIALSVSGQCSRVKGRRRFRFPVPGNVGRDGDKGTLPSTTSTSALKQSIEIPGGRHHTHEC
jgi:hypothetical protein